MPRTPVIPWAATAVIDSTDDEGWRITPGAGDPVQAQLGFDQGRLVYEARVPLHYRGYPPFELDSPVGLGLRLPVPDRPMGGMSNPRGDFGGGGGRFRWSRRPAHGWRPGSGNVGHVHGNPGAVD